MTISRAARPAVLAACLVMAASGSLQAQATKGITEPRSGQPGKDVVWVPTSPELVDQMLDLANVTAKDYVVDLGSGDGRNVIAAAKRGARALGVEYDPNLVEISKRNAAAAGVSGKAQFARGDMFQADFSKATVLALFLLPENLLRLRPKFLELKPGTRIVVNTLMIPDWKPDDMAGYFCDDFCSANLWIVPAKVAGTWQLPQGQLTLTQTFQMVSGALKSGATVTPVTAGRLRGDQITLTIGDAEYIGRVDGKAMKGQVKTGGRETAWTARRQ